MKNLMNKRLFKSGGGQHIHEPKAKHPYGCAFTDFGSYVSHRYAGKHGDSYAKISLLHEKALRERVDMLALHLPGLKNGDIKSPFSVLDPLLLVLCLMVSPGGAR